MEKKFNRNAVTRESVMVDNLCNEQRAYNVSGEACFANDILESVVNGSVTEKGAEVGSGLVASFNMYSSDNFGIHFQTAQNRSEVLEAIESFIADLK